MRSTRQRMGGARTGVFVVTVTVAILAGQSPARAALPPQPDRGFVGFNDTVWSTVPIGSTVYVAGDFTSAILPNGTWVPRQHLAALDAGTGSLLPWNPSASDSVLTLVRDPATNILYAGGRFLSIDGIGRSRLAAFGSSGNLLPWAPSTSGAVRGMDLGPGGIMYVGGNFTVAGGARRLRLAAFDATTGALLPWSPSADVVVRDVEVAGDVYIGGDFTTINGVSSGHVARILADGTAAPWADPVAERVLALTVDGGVVYSAAGGAGGQVYAHTAATGARRWRRHGDGDVQAIDYIPSENTVVAGGHFQVWAGADRRWIVELRASDGVMTAWTPTMNGGSWSVYATSSKLYLGGRFTHISGVTARRFASWSLA